MSAYLFLFLTVKITASATANAATPNKRNTITVYLLSDGSEVRASGSGRAGLALAGTAFGVGIGGSAGEAVGCGEGVIHGARPVSIGSFSPGTYAAAASGGYENRFSDPKILLSSL